MRVEAYGSEKSNVSGKHGQKKDQRDGDWRALGVIAEDMADLRLGSVHDVSVAKVLCALFLERNFCGCVDDGRDLADGDQGTGRRSSGSGWRRIRRGGGSGAKRAEDQGKVQLGDDEVCGNVFLALHTQRGMVGKPLILYRSVRFRRIEEAYKIDLGLSAGPFHRQWEEGLELRFRVPDQQESLVGAVRRVAIFQRELELQNIPRAEGYGAGERFIGFEAAVHGGKQRISTTKQWGRG